MKGMPKGMPPKGLMPGGKKTAAPVKKGGKKK